MRKTCKLWKMKKKMKSTLELRNSNRFIHKSMFKISKTMQVIFQQILQSFILI